MRNIRSPFIIKYWYGDKIRNDDTDKVCGATGKVHTEFWWGETREKETIWKTQV